MGTTVDMKKRFLGAFFLLMALSTAAAGGTIYVDDDAPGPIYDGMSWASAYKYLQDALAAADSAPKPVEIWVARGVYWPDMGGGKTAGDKDATFQLINGVAIYGGFAGTGLGRDERDYEKYLTTLSGDLNGDDDDDPTPVHKLVWNADWTVHKDFRVENARHVVTSSNTDDTAVLDGFWIVGGYARSTLVNGGGGLFNRQGSPKVRNCMFFQNGAGGFYTDEGSPYGGGVYNDGGGPEFDNCAFIENATGLENNSSSAAIYDSNGNAIYRNCRFDKNCSSAGHVVESNGSNAVFISCSFTNNMGGAFRHSGLESAIPTFVSCQFKNNNYPDPDYPYEWHTTARGGAMRLSAGKPKLTNCYFAGNQADEGGALYVWGESSPNITNCTIWNNSCSGSGGGIYSESDSALTLTNCIVWGNAAGQTGEAAQIYQEPGTPTPTINYCCVQDWKGTWGGLHNTGLDPEFDAAYRLMPDSPCIDAGDNDALPHDTADVDNDGDVAELLPVDCDGNPRIRFAVVDMGAFEYNPANVIYVDDTAPGGGDGTSWEKALRSLQTALDVAKPGNEIWVAQGVYRPHPIPPLAPPDERSMTFGLENGVVLLGGYSGFGAANPDDRNIQSYVSVLSGDLLEDDGDLQPGPDNSYHVVSASGVGATAVLDGFTVRGGNADGPDTHGGGLLIVGNTSPTIRDCIFEGNHAEWGGAVALSGEAGSVAGRFAADGCTFIGNVATQEGGAVHVEFQRWTKLDIELGRPTAGDNLVAISRCILLGNKATKNGGGISVTNASLSLVNCCLSGNSAMQRGGGLHCANSYLPIGDIDTSATDLNLVNCTFNSYPDLSSGIYIDAQNLAWNIEVTNCILWRDPISAFPLFSVGESGITVDVRYSCLARADLLVMGMGNIFEDPLLEDADGQDGVPGTTDDNLRLSERSPCIDAGDNDVVISINTDLDGKPRRVDNPKVHDTGHGTPPIVDMGAYEWQ